MSRQEFHGKVDQVGAVIHNTHHHHYIVVIDGPSSVGKDASPQRCCPECKQTMREGFAKAAWRALFRMTKTNG